MNQSRQKGQFFSCLNRAIGGGLFLLCMLSAGDYAHAVTCDIHQVIPDPDGGFNDLCVPSGNTVNCNCSDQGKIGTASCIYWSSGACAGQPTDSPYPCNYSACQVPNGFQGTVDVNLDDWSTHPASPPPPLTYTIVDQLPMIGASSWDIYYEDGSNCETRPGINRTAGGGITVGTNIPISFGPCGAGRYVLHINAEDAGGKFNSGRPLETHITLEQSINMFFHVYQKGTSTGISGAEITINGETRTTDGLGNVNFSGMSTRDYSFAVSKPGYYNSGDNFHTLTGEYRRDVEMTLIPVTNAAFVSQTVRTTMTTGQSYPVSVTMQNNGNVTWTSAAPNPFQLGDPLEGASVWGVGARVPMASGETIAPGASKTFSFNVTAPSTPGSYNFQWRMIQEGVQWFGVGTTNVVVNVQAPQLPLPVINSAANDTATVGTFYSYRITASNSPTSFSATPLPAGLNFVAPDMISGTPTTAGSFPINLTATNATGPGTAVLTLTVNPAPLGLPVINSAANETATVGAFYSYRITATNSPTSFSATPLPAGLNFVAPDTISGTPTTAGNFPINLTATNATGPGTAVLTLTVNPAPLGLPVINSAANETATVGAFYSYRITATNSPTSFSATSLPAGLNFVAPDTISGTPTTAGNFPINLTATNATGPGTAILTLTVNPAPPGLPVITGGLTVSGIVGQAIDRQITATNNPTFTSNNPMPDGVLLTALGRITGTPTRAGTFTINLTLTNAAGTINGVLTIQIAPAPPPPAQAIQLTNTSAFPVPFKPSAGHTNITFINLQNDPSITIKIYTIMGELVADLRNDAGGASIQWPVKNSDGESVASGVYIYVIKNTIDEKRGKLVIIR